MDVTTFVLLYEERKKYIKRPRIKSNDIKPFFKIFNKRFKKNRDIEGRGMFMKFLSDLEYLQNNLSYVENKEDSTIEEEDIKDAEKNFKDVVKYLKSKDDILVRMNLLKEKKELSKKLNSFF